ncbi:unnamed protein product [Symbiodinium necroappetens]|uniref:Uncharacterized protein n=1 Tax=Symbiodinium necroappetens TaxID=1628268 RepID=A0A812VS47_9DINO|nr:unnamed protein product [Symbiodinium necroappetens]
MGTGEPRTDAPGSSGSTTSSTSSEVELQRFCQFVQSDPDAFELAIKIFRMRMDMAQTQKDRKSAQVPPHEDQTVMAKPSPKTRAKVGDTRVNRVKLRRRSVQRCQTFTIQL